MRRLVLLAIAGCGFRHGALDHDSAVVTDDARTDAIFDAKVDAMPDARINIDARTCPAGFVTLAMAPATSKYQAFSAQSQTTAISSCAALGTHLVRLDTQGETNAVYTFVDQQTGTGDTHLYRVVGARDKSVVPNQWLDLDNTTPLTFLPWGAGEPTNNAGEDCMLVRLEGATTTKVTGADQCTTLHEYACECE